MAGKVPRSCVVPGYRVERLLGVGSQAEVWLGQEVATGEPVALKRIPADTPAAVAACQAEAASLAALDHPNLIALRGCVPLDAALVLVLELAEGGTLAGLLDRRGTLTPPEVVAAISPVAAALAHAHDTGLLHGDVSAANILFTRAGRPKLADLGLARLLSAMAGSAAESPWPAGSRDKADWFGTPAYLDPTIAAGGPAGLASDVFSLAAVALHALTGAGPWQPPGQPVPSVEQAVTTAATGTITGLAERLRVVSPDLAAVLTRALDPDPFRRGTAAELALDLGASLAPARVELTGGRIGRQATGRQEARREEARPREGVLATGGLDRVPLDLTRIAPPRPPADIAALLRCGGLASDDAASVSPRSASSSAARPGRLPRISSAMTAPVRRLGALEWRSWLSAVGGPDPARSAGPGRPSPLAQRRNRSAQDGEPSRPAGRHRSSGQGGRGAHSPAVVPGRRRSKAGRSKAGRSKAGRSKAGRSKAGRSKAGRSTAGRSTAGRSIVGHSAVGLAAATVLAVACIVGWPHLHRRPADAATAHPPGHPPSATNRGRPPAASNQAGHPPPASNPPGGSVAGSSAALGRYPDAAGLGTAAELGRVLAELTAIREQAYAQRRSDVLAGVYASQTLLAADDRQLYRSIPAGCALIGVRTVYRNPQFDETRQPADASAGQPSEVAARRGSRPVSITVTALVPSATLRCGGVVRGRTPPAGPLRLRLVLSNLGQGWRISSERAG